MLASIIVDVGFLMRLHHSTQVESKLKKCFKDLSLSFLLNNHTFWLKAKYDVENILALFDTVIADEVDNTRPNSFCWKTRLEVRLNGHNQQLVEARIGNHTVLDTAEDILTDPRFYYQFMLKYKSRVVDPAGINNSFICIPRVYLAGFPKSGSTALDSLVTMHPLILHGISKEPRWWSPPNGPTSNHNKFKPSLSYFIKYAVQYSNAIEKMEVNRNVMLIDSSPNLFPSLSSIGLGERFEDICLLPVAMSTILPDPRYIVILRNPIDFLYSRFWFSCSSTVYRHGNGSTINPVIGPRLFHSMVIRRLGIFSKCRLLYNTERCTFAQAYIQDESNVEFNCGAVPLHFALYYVHVVKWFSVLPRQSFYITTHERFIENPYTEAQKVWNFLEILQPLNIKTQDWKERLEKGKNRNEKYKYNEDPQLKMLPTTRKILQQFFVPFNILLSTILGEDDVLWKR